MKQIYYLEQSTNKIKVAAHTHFDEGLADTPLDQLPPYARQLRKALGHNQPPIDNNDIPLPDDLDLLSCSELFPITFSYEFTIKSSDITNEFNTSGFILKEDPVLQRCFISDIKSRSTAAQFSRWHSRLIGAFILSVDSVIVFNLDDTEAALSQCLVDHQHQTGPHKVVITFAHDRSLIQQDLDPEASIPSPIQMDQICHLATIYETGEEIKYQAQLDQKWFEYFKDLTGEMPNDKFMMVQEVNDTSIDTKEDDNLENYIHKASTMQFTRRQLKS